MLTKLNHTEVLYKKTLSFKFWYCFSDTLLCIGARAHLWLTHKKNRNSIQVFLEQIRGRLCLLFKSLCSSGSPPSCSSRPTPAARLWSLGRTPWLPRSRAARGWGSFPPGLAGRVGAAGAGRAGTLGQPGSTVPLAAQGSLCPQWTRHNSCSKKDTIL